MIDLIFQSFKLKRKDLQALTFDETGWDVPIVAETSFSIFLIPLFVLNDIIIKTPI